MDTDERERREREVSHVHTQRERKRQREKEAVGCEDVLKKWSLAKLRCTRSLPHLCISMQCFDAIYDTKPLEIHECLPIVHENELRKV